jgi:hypothetical protein
VHRICLLRWVIIDPAANGKICCICRLPYEEEVMPQLVPKTPPGTFNSLPGFMSSLSRGGSISS